MLQNEFKALGFNEKTTLVYTALLRVNRASASDLAKITGLQRTTVYNILDSLCSKHLAGITFEEKSRIYHAEPPEQLVQYFQELTSSATAMLPILQVMAKQQTSHPKIRYYTGIEGLRSVNDDYLNVKSKEYFYIGSMADIEARLGKDYLKNYVNTRIRRKIWSNALRVSEGEINEESYTSSVENFRRVKILPLSTKFNIGSMTLYDGKVAYISTAGENFALTIESRELYNLLKLVWDCLWLAAK